MKRTVRTHAVPRLDLVCWDISEAEGNLVAGLGRRERSYPKSFDSLHGSPHCPSAALYDNCITWSYGALVNYAYQHDPINRRLNVVYVLHREGERSLGHAEVPQSVSDVKVARAQLW
jgi:hypothetical protein